MPDSKQPDIIDLSKPHLMRSLVGVIVGSFFLRAAAGAMGVNLQFYFNMIHQAALSPEHPLRRLVGAGHVYQLSYALGGIIIGSFFASELLGAPLLGTWSDRRGRKLFIILGPVFGIVAMQITALTTVIWFLIFSRLLEGLSTASNVPSTLGYLAESTSHSSKLRARVVGFYEIATIGGAALGFSLGGWLWHHFGNPAVFAGIPLTSPAFALNAIVYLVSLSIFWIGLKGIPDQHARASLGNSAIETLQHYWRIVSSSRLVGFAPAWIAINAVLGVWINMTARILTDKTHIGHQLLVGRFDSFQAGNIQAAYAIFFAMGIFAWSFLLPQMKRTTAMLVGTAGLFASCFLLFVMNNQPALDTALVIPLAAFLVISIMVQSGFTPAALAHLADITEDHADDRGVIMGLYSVFLGLGQFIGASIGGPFVDWLGANGMILITLIFGMIAAFLLVRLAMRENRLAVVQQAGTKPG